MNREMDDSIKGDPLIWRKCNVCKKPLFFGKKYWTCSVSTCNRRRTGLRFCSVACFDAHLPDMRHKDAGAIDVLAPSASQWQQYAAKEGEDAVWPPAPPKPKETEAQQLPSGGFSGSADKGSSSPVVVRRRSKSEG